jgi:hypothetical protein
MGEGFGFGMTGVRRVQYVGRVKMHSGGLFCFRAKHSTAGARVLPRADLPGSHIMNLMSLT